MVILLLSLFVVFAFYFYLRSRNNYWNNRGVSVVKTNFLLGASFDFIIGRRSLEEIYENIYTNSDPEERYVGSYDSLAPFLFVKDPDLIYNMTVTDFRHFQYRTRPLDYGGRLIYSLIYLRQEEWKDVRHKLASTFTPNRIKKMQSLIEECGDMMAERYFRPLAKAGQPVDAKEIAARFALDVIGKCAFGLQFNTMNESESLYREMGKKFAASGFKNSLRLVLQFTNPKLLKLFRMKIAADEVEDFFFNLLREAEESRLREKERRVDFLQLMLDIKHETENKINHLFTDDHIASNMYIFYVAGHETSANTIVFALYELALNPDIQEKLRQEILECQEANDGSLDYDAINNMRYMEMVVSETLRLHVPIAFNVRVCTETYQVPGTSFVIKPGETIIYSISAIHRDEKYFPNPMKFDPERFSPENMARMNSHAYRPFGTGPKMCLGVSFAKFEIKICLISILSRFKLSTCEQTEVPMTLKKGGIFHAPQNEVWLSIQEI